MTVQLLDQLSRSVAFKPAHRHCLSTSKPPNTTRTNPIASHEMRTIQERLSLANLASTDDRNHTVNGTDRLGNDSRTPIEQWHGIGATAEGSDLTGVTLVHELGTAARDTFRVSTTTCSCSVQKKTANAIDIRTESLPLTPHSCPVSLACLATDTCANRRETLRSLVWAGHGNTEKTSNLTTVQHGQH